MPYNEGDLQNEFDSQNISQKINIEIAKNKYKELIELLPLIDNLKIQNKKIVFTNGVFDILHIGHLSLLEKAKTFGDILIVGINSDSSVKKIKGPLRPIIPEYERIQMISALHYPDFVIIFHENDPCDIISKIKPDIHVKGGDYNPEDFEKMPEAKIIKEYGGDIKIIKILEGLSTTNIFRSLNIN